jgi:transposase
VTDHGCFSCRRLGKQLESLRKQKAALLARNRWLTRQYQKEQALRLAAESRIRELQQTQRPTACNSSLPPSANPIGAKPPVLKKPTGRKRGAQIGHGGKSRKLLPIHKVNEFVTHRPEVCGHCQAPLDPKTPGEVVGRHQVAELPQQPVLITEHQSLACRCGRCGKLCRGKIPPEVSASCTGPRLSALIGLLSARLKGSRRDIAWMLEQMLGCPIALGSVCAREKELSEALAGPYQQLLQEAATSKVKYVDETGWKLAGKSRWLWVCASQDQVVFRIDKERTRSGLKGLLDQKIRGYFCTDRAGIYDLLKLMMRQLCWAHLRRDFVAAIERGGAGEAAAAKMLEVCRLMFKLWHRFKSGKLKRGQLREQIQPLKVRMHEALEEGAASGQKKTAGLCRGLLKREEALWRFVEVKGLEPTNNLAERMLRPAVIWRKKSFGSDSLDGCRYVERILSVSETLKLRDQNVLAYLAGAIAAHRRGQATEAIAPPLATRASKPHRKSPLDSASGRATGVEQEPLRKVA